MARNRRRKHKAKRLKEPATRHVGNVTNDGCAGQRDSDVYEFRDDASSEIITPLRKKEEENATREESIEEVGAVKADLDTESPKEECDDNWSSNEVSFFLVSVCPVITIFIRNFDVSEVTCNDFSATLLNDFPALLATSDFGRYENC